MLHLNITFPEDLKEELDKEAKREHTQRSTLIQKAVNPPISPRGTDEKKVEPRMSRISRIKNAPKIKGTKSKQSVESVESVESVAQKSVSFKSSVSRNLGLAAASGDDVAVSDAIHRRWAYFNPSTTYSSLNFRCTPKAAVRPSGVR